MLKNFLTEEECESISTILEKVKDIDWHGSKKSPNYLLAKNNGKYELTNKLIEINQKYNNIFDKKYRIDGPSSMSVMRFGSVCELHADNCEEINYDWIWTAVAYFNDFDGGEISYPKKSIVYKPEKGDLLFHRPDYEYEHQILEVLSDKRFITSAYIRKHSYKP